MPRRSGRCAEVSFLVSLWFRWFEGVLVQGFRGSGFRGLGFGDDGLEFRISILGLQRVLGVQRDEGNPAGFPLDESGVRP